MKNVAAFLVGLTLLFAVDGACSARLLEGPATTLLPSDIAANPGKYDGKHVDVRGCVVVGPKNRNIFDSQQGVHSSEGACLGLAGPNSMFTSFHKRYIRKLSGTFRRNLCGEHDVGLYWCGQSGIELDRGSRP